VKPDSGIIDVWKKFRNDMTTNADSPFPLDYDPGREAYASIGGYNYQILTSVLQWVDLQMDEILWLEAAEDFDITSGRFARSGRSGHRLSRFRSGRLAPRRPSGIFLNL
jgi:hypothetical protein